MFFFTEVFWNVPSNRKFGYIDKKIKDLKLTEDLRCGLEFGKEKVFLVRISTEEISTFKSQILRLYFQILNFERFEF